MIYDCRSIICAICPLQFDDHIRGLLLRENVVSETQRWLLKQSAVESVNPVWRVDFDFRFLVPGPLVLYSTIIYVSELVRNVCHLICWMFLVFLEDEIIFWIAYFQGRTVSFRERTNLYLGGGFKYFYIFTPTWGNDPIWLIFFQMGWNHQHIYIYT